MIKIVTDSSSDISAHLAAQLGVSVLPVRIRLGDQVYRDGVDIDRSDFYRHLAQGVGRPFPEPPLPEDFQRVYRRLLTGTDQVLSLHLSSRLSKTAQVAREAAKTFLGRSKITVVDSHMISWGLELLVTFAAQAAHRGATAEDIVRLVRGAIPHIYMVFHADNPDYAQYAGRLSRTRLQGETLSGLKPLLIMEEGEILPMERIRVRGKPTERLLEFVSEFARFDRATILQGRLSDGAQSLFEHLLEAFPEKRLDIKPYGLALATCLGPDALGIGVYEGLC
jgi:DegV family protein with EDD domain